MSVQCIQMFARDRGQDQREYSFLMNDGSQQTAIFVRDEQTNAFLYHYEQDGEGNPTDDVQAEIIEHLFAQFGVPQGKEFQHGSYIKRVNYSDLPYDQRSFGKMLNRMEKRDFDAWFLRHTGDIKAYQRAEQSLNAVNGQYERRLALKEAIEKIRERGKKEAAEGYPTGASTPPASTPPPEKPPASPPPPSDSAGSDEPPADDSEETPPADEEGEEKSDEAKPRRRGRPPAAK